MGQNILYHLLKDNKDTMLLSQLNLTKDQLRNIYDIINLSDIQEEDFQIFNLIYNFIQNPNKSIEDALDFCKYGFKRDFSYTTIDHNWTASLTKTNNLPFYILNYLAIVTGTTVERIEDTIESNNITIEKPAV